MSGKLRIGIDAGNLVRDRRGMGRVARGIIKAAVLDPAVEPTLLAPRRDDRRALRAEFADVAVQAPGRARKR